ncbi:helicase C-terminal domain-containing protein [Weissella cibaria]|uniref:helicase C-terminal domain-containing protein n=1 Tax=Weissella cibaria TaxID=137591 RepID=UPI00106E3D3D|nr:helicase C-terminal domain-containing protein [Weissella cibaria]TVV29571.1 DEAD/DEAH box helicase [Weissella cibaria]
MLNRDIYAVVDLETTRTTSETGRIIQIAVAFVQNKKIINQFSTLVNPGEQIPRNITQLTGITQNMVKGAPFFEDVAMTLHAMLQGTIFVAHNVNFDLPFLNAEFERVGLTALKSTAIDTVPLSQILWPTAPGYRLVDMTNYLSLEHNHPHQADSDALATGELLIAILKRAEGLPMITLQALADLPLVLPRDTKTVFEKALAKNQAEPQPLPSHLQVIDSLALRRFSEPAPLVTGKATSYPAKKAAKEQLYGKTLAYREQQAKLMNAIYTHYTEAELSETPGETAFVAEAPTGMGKTLAYLLPYAYLADEQRKQVVVAVPTITLQQQVTETINTTLKDILPFEVRGASLKGRTHYLNLQSFKRALRVDEGSTSLQFIKAQILVWLTETLTGDFDELNLINPQVDFMAKLAQPANNPAGSPYYGHEFSERQHVLAQNAQFLVVNHAYLAEYAAELGDSIDTPYLIIDEAQNLPNAVLEQSRHQLPFQVWLTRVQNATNLVLRDNEPSIGIILNRLVGGQQLKSRFLQSLEALSSELPKLQVAFYRRFLLNGHTPATKGHYEVELPISDLAQFWVDQTHRLQSMRQAVRDLADSLDYLLAQFSNTKNAFSLSERQHLADFRRLLESIAKYEQRLTTFQQDLVDFPDASVFWLTENQNHDNSNLKLSGGLLHTLDFFKDKVYPHFMPPTVIGATLFTSTKSGYLYDRLNIDRETVFARRYPEVFDFAHQAELVMVENAPSPTDGGYVSYLAKQLVQLTTTVQENTLVLFNSLETIQQVYNHMQSNQTWQQGNMTLLAQGMTGTRSKIMKRMANESHLVVLGANSFWEGIDLPGDQLRLVVIARLPFDQPNTVLQRAEEAVLMAHGKQPFYQSTLPKAVLRLRQGVGRLIRKPDDFGAVVIYDPRILTKSYGKTLRNMMPDQMPQHVSQDRDVVPELKKFFDQHR